MNRLWPLVLPLDAAAWAHCSYNGYPRDTSPNIDWLAIEERLKAIGYF